MVACFWKKHCPAAPSGQRNSAIGRPTTCGRIHFQMRGIELGEVALADLGVFPIDAVGMRQRHALTTVFALRFVLFLARCV